MKERIVLIRASNGAKHTTYKDVVWFNISMHDIAFPEKAHGEEKLMSVRSDRTDIKTDIFTELFNNISEIHASNPVSQILFHIKLLPYLSDSKTRHRWPLCSNVRSKRTTCFLSSGSA